MTETADLLDACRVLGISIHADARESKNAFDTLRCCHNSAESDQSENSTRLRRAYRTVRHALAADSAQSTADDQKYAPWTANPVAMELFADISQQLSPEQVAQFKARVAKLLKKRANQREARSYPDSGVRGSLFLTFLCAGLATARTTLTSGTVIVESLATQFVVYFTIMLVAGGLGACADASSGRSTTKHYRIIVLLVTLAIWVGDLIEKIRWF